MIPAQKQNTVKIISSYLVSLLLIIVALYNTGLIAYEQERILNTTSAHPDGGFNFILPLGVKSTNEFYGKTALVLFENGVPMGPADSIHEDIRRVGQGRYSHWNSDLFFSATDNSDPRTNGYSYSIRYSPPVPLYVILGLMIAWLVVYRSRILAMREWIQRTSPVTITVILVLITAAYRGWIWFTNPNLTFDGHMVLGMPVSDARAWDTLAAELSAGVKSDSSWELWDARRPLYSWLMGAVYMITGPSVFVTQLLKFILSLLSTALIYDSLRRILPLHIAAFSVLIHAFLQFDAYESLITRTEGFGYFFTHLALWFFILGGENARRETDEDGERAEHFFKRSLRLFFLAGISLGLANLIRPLNLPAIIVIPPLILYSLFPYFGFTRKTFKKGALILLVPLIGCGITLAPWLIRQKIKYDILSISDNSVEMTLAASLPEFGTWSSKISQMHPNATLIAERYKFFEQKLIESLEVNSSFYLANSWFHFKEILKSLKISSGLLLIGLFISLLSVWKEGKSSRLNNLLLLGFVGGVTVTLLNFGHRSYLFWLFGSLLAILFRNPAAILAGLVLPSAVTLGFCAFQGERVIYGLVWQVVCLALFAQWACLHAIAHFNVRELVGWTSPALFTAWNTKLVRINTTLFSSVAIVLFFLALFGAIRQEAIPMKSLTEQMLPEEIQTWVNKALTESCTDLSALKPYLTARKGRIRKDYLIRIAQGQQATHWNTLFNQPTFPRTIFEVQPRPPENFFVMAGDTLALSPNDEYIFVGAKRLHEHNMSFEVIRAYGAASTTSGLPCPPANVIDSHRKHLLESLDKGLLIRAN